MRSAYVKLIPNHTLEPHPACLWPVEHACVRYLELAECQLVDVTGSQVRLSERGRQTANPSPEETLDRPWAQSITDFLQSCRVGAGSKSVVQGFIANPGFFLASFAPVCSRDQ